MADVNAGTIMEIWTYGTVHTTPYTLARLIDKKIDVPITIANTANLELDWSKTFEKPVRMQGN